jgi:cell wall-associated NlpC family hydrolase
MTCHACIRAPSETGRRFDASEIPAIRLDLAARAYLGTPFLHQGRDPRVGIDCVGLVSLAVRDCGLIHLLGHDFTAYARDPANGALQAKLRAAFGDPVCCLHVGDVVSIDFRGQTRHVGVIGLMPDGRPSLIHTYRTPAKVIEHGLDAKWARRITGVHRVEAMP